MPTSAAQRWSRHCIHSHSQPKLVVARWSALVHRQRHIAAAAAKQEPGSDSLWLLVGLGNPGKQYQGTRHNVGFRLVDTLEEQAGVRLDKEQHNALVARALLWNHRVLLAKPTTYMNESGRAVAKLSQYYKVPRERVLVVLDDLDLPVGGVRLRGKGGHGGHNGLRSIVQHFGGQSDFPRLRIGIGRPPGRQEVANYVLQGFGKAEAGNIANAMQQSITTLQAVLELGMEKALSGVRV
ncbi:hypothetical protein WJX73_007139 [Symbiochloris irregularis]|uniref:peptidyl-tRNA hydrolase n=1 Tax=Symbiochloris irregularis TaxID=706552 RepID=A0AAW1PYT5_9CHLO